MKIATALTALGRSSEIAPGTVNLPVVRASTVTFDSLAHMDEVQAAFAADDPNNLQPTYGITNLPLKVALEQLSCEIEGGPLASQLRAQAYGSGLAAVAAGLMSQVKAGDHVLITDSVYGPTRRLATEWLPRYGCTIDFFPPTATANELAALMKPNTSVVYVESPGSLTFEMQDIPALAAVAHERGAVVVMDNAWATGLYFNAFEHGVDVVVVPSTKYYAGHSDVLSGVVVSNARCWPLLRSFTLDFGQTINGDDAFLTLRGMRTLHVRLPHHNANALKTAQAIDGMRDRFPRIKRVLHPGLTSHPGHAIWKRDFKGASGLFAIELEGTRSQMASMADNYRYFKLGYSWGGFDSLATIANLQGIRNCGAPIPAGHSILRVHIGLEDPEDLLNDLMAGFERLHR